MLIDCDDPYASDESLIGPAMMMGARIFLFGAERRMQVRKHLAIRFHTGVIVLPADVDRLATLLVPANRAAAAAEPQL